MGSNLENLYARFEEQTIHFSIYKLRQYYSEIMEIQTANIAWVADHITETFWR